MHQASISPAAGIANAARRLVRAPAPSRSPSFSRAEKYMNNRKAYNGRASAVIPVSKPVTAYQVTALRVDGLETVRCSATTDASKKNVHTVSDIIADS